MAAVKQREAAVACTKWPEKPKRAQWVGSCMALNRGHNSTIRPQREKKRTKFGGAPHTWGPHPFGPTTLRTNPSAPSLRDPTFLGCVWLPRRGPHPSGSSPLDPQTFAPSFSPPPPPPPLPPSLLPRLGGAGGGGSRRGGGLKGGRLKGRRRRRG